MRTALALAAKFGLTFVAAVIAGYFAGVVNFGLFFVIAIVGTVVNYIVGDLFVLPAAGNIVASLGDGLMAGVIAYLLTVRRAEFFGNTPVMFAAVFGIIVAIGEFFFHIWLEKDEKVSPNP